LESQADLKKPYHKMLDPAQLTLILQASKEIKEEAIGRPKQENRGILSCNYITMYYNRFMEPEELRKWREDREMPRRELAKALGVHLMALAYWEWGKRRIPPFLHLALKALDKGSKQGDKNGTAN
jgi:DNA-binding transcriptional regulator YiaG